MSAYPTEVRADLQRYYGIDLDNVGEGVSVWQAASCLACLPLGSSTAARYDEKASLSMEGHLIYNVLDMLCQGGKYPRYWENQSRATGDGTLQFSHMSVEDFDKWYSSKFEEVDRWQM